MELVLGGLNLRPGEARQPLVQDMPAQQAGGVEAEVEVEAGEVGQPQGRVVGRIQVHGVVGQVQGRAVG